MPVVIASHRIDVGGELEVLQTTRQAKFRSSCRSPPRRSCLQGSEPERRAKSGPIAGRPARTSRSGAGASALRRAAIPLGKIGSENDTSLRLSSVAVSAAHIRSILPCATAWKRWSKVTGTHSSASSGSAELRLHLCRHLLAQGDRVADRLAGRVLVGERPRVDPVAEHRACRSRGRDPKSPQRLGTPGASDSPDREQECQARFGWPFAGREKPSIFRVPCSISYRQHSPPVIRLPWSVQRGSDQRRLCGETWRDEAPDDEGKRGDQHAAHDRVVARSVKRIGAVEHRHQRHCHIQPVLRAGTPAAFIITTSADREMM